MNRITVATSLRIATALAVQFALITSASAATIWDRARDITTGLQSFQPLIMWLALIGGLGVTMYAIFQMYQLSKPDNRGEITWFSILIKLLAGVCLIGFVFSTDIFAETVLGTTVSGTAGGL